MSFAKVHSGQPYYLKGQIIDIEVDISRGLHSFNIVGLPDKAVEEARDRISAAIKNSGFVSPKQKNHKVVVSLAPAHVRKEGPLFDLAMALGYLLANKEIFFEPKEKLFIGELSLDGGLRKVQGVLPIVAEAKRQGIKEIFLPEQNVKEAELVEGLKIFGVKNLNQIIKHLDPKVFERNLLLGYPVENLESITSTGPSKTGQKAKRTDEVLIEDVKGQEIAKRGLEIAAAGGHNILMCGPPGTGKTMLAKALCNLMPELDSEHALEVTSIHSVAGLTSDLIVHPPFRSPHHTSSYASLVGGGAVPRPGEVTLAHRGILFLDEFSEFPRQVIETLREPLEERVINISRAKGSVHFPAHFMLVAAMNPCPCGFATSSKRRCTCSVIDFARYRKKISGPILDRIDLWVDVGDIEYEKLGILSKQTETTETVRKKIEKAREIQNKRFENHSRSIHTNSEMNGKELEELSKISAKANQTLLKSARLLNLSMRAYHRVWRIARTIADLDKSETLEETHVLEALQYRTQGDMK